MSDTTHIAISKAIRDNATAKIRGWFKQVENDLHDALYRFIQNAPDIESQRELLNHISLYADGPVFDATLCTHTLHVLSGKIAKNMLAEIDKLKADNIKPIETETNDEAA